VDQLACTINDPFITGLDELILLMLYLIIIPAGLP